MLMFWLGLVVAIFVGANHQIERGKQTMAITYSISGGADAAKFTIDAATGKLTFKTAADFENPGDANRDNVYEVQIKATDAGGAATTQDVKVTVTDVSENAPPQITSAAAVSVKENTTTVMTVTATDPDDGGTPPDPVPPDTSTAGKITEFSNAKGGSFKIDGGTVINQVTATNNYSLQNPDQYTLRFEVRSGDHTWSSTSDCSEIQETQKYDAGAEVTISYKFLIEPNSGSNFVNTAGWLLVGEWHNDDSVMNIATSPPISMGMTGNKLQLYLRYSTAVGGSNAQLRTLWTDSKAFPLNQFVDVEIKFKNTNASDGYLTLTVGGIKVVDYKGAVGYGVRGYWMEGIYRATVPETVAVKYKNMSVTGN
jgi:hypothetical protein